MLLEEIRPTQEGKVVAVASTCLCCSPLERTRRWAKHSDHSHFPCHKCLKETAEQEGLEVVSLGGVCPWLLISYEKIEPVLHDREEAIQIESRAIFQHGKDISQTTKVFRMEGRIYFAGSLGSCMDTGHKDVYYSIPENALEKIILPNEYREMVERTRNDQATLP